MIVTAEAPLCATRVWLSQQVPVQRARLRALPMPAADQCRPEQSHSVARPVGPFVKGKEGVRFSTKPWSTRYVRRPVRPRCEHCLRRGRDAYLQGCDLALTFYPGAIEAGRQAFRRTRTAAFLI